MEPQGLVYCGPNWGNTYCITKSIEFSVSLGIFLFLIHDFVLRFFRQRQFNFFFLVCIQMMIALIANIVFTLDHNIFSLSYLEGYAYDIYYTTIVYQVSRRLVRIKEGSQYYKWIWLSVHGILIFFIIFLTITFILRNIFTYYNCQQVWFLILNILQILLSTLMVTAGKCHTKFQSQKIQGMQEKNIKNPLPDIWKWISINIVCQFSRFLRSFIYIVSPYNCQFTENYTANQVLDLLFELFGFHVGIVATIIFFRKKQTDQNISSKQFQSTIRERLGSGYSKQIEMESANINKNLVDVMVKDPLQQQRLTAKNFLDDRNTKRVTLIQNKQVIFSI